VADPSDLLIDRTLVLFRHAKAVSAGSMPDFERPLADRGRADAEWRTSGAPLAHASSPARRSCLRR
jgi:phosphohistidine phosphatase SixA